MRKTITKTDEEYCILQEFWRILQEFYDPESTDEYWDRFIKATKKFERAHPDNLLCEQLILMTMAYIEKKYKKDNTSSYAKLLTTVRYAYKDFIKNADKKDKEILNEVLSANEGVTEQQIITKVRQLHNEESVQQLSMFLGE